YLEPVMTEPVEMFNPSDATGRAGRLRTGRMTGTIAVVVRNSMGAAVGGGEVEVRSRKLNYLSEYRWMLQRIADEAAEAAQSHFAPSSLTAFRPAHAGSAETVYQRFAFVSSLLASTDFDASLRLILN